MARTAAAAADVVVVHVSVVVVAARRRSRTIACDRIIYSNCPTIYVRTRALTRKCTHWGARARADTMKRLQIAAQTQSPIPSPGMSGIAKSRWSLTQRACCTRYLYVRANGGPPAQGAVAAAAASEKLTA